MPTMIQISDDKYECVRRYIEAALDHVRMVEHKLTEVLEKLEEEHK